MTPQYHHAFAALNQIKSRTQNVNRIHTTDTDVLQAQLRVKTFD